MGEHETIRASAAAFGAEPLPNNYDKTLLCEWGHCIKPAVARRITFPEGCLSEFKPWAFGTPPIPTEGGWYESRIRLCREHLDMMGNLMSHVDRGSNG